LGKLQNSMDDKHVIDILLCLAAEGGILGKCPKCTLPLHFYELTDSRCEKCGIIDFEDVVFVKVNKENMS
jgi:hypothetical protein